MILTDTDVVYRGIRPLQRLGAMTRELVGSNPFSALALPSRTPTYLTSIPPDPWPGNMVRGRDFLAGTFYFSGQVIEKEHLSWRPPHAKTEWVAGLHGFEWLRDLRSVGGDRARRMAREMVTSWIQSCVRPEGPGWRADVVGVRMASWITFHDFFCASANEDFQEMYFASLAQQTRFLNRALPGRLVGLDLMRALKGLVYAVMALEGYENKFERVFHLILKEISTQILPDGAHVSRSPQQTFEFLQILVDLRAALIAARFDLPEELQHAIDRIVPAVKFFRHGDGTLCQFNGAQEGNAHLCDTTLMHSGARGGAMPSLPHAGYERSLLGRSSLVMDVGAETSPKYGGRNHAGLLSFEYSYGRDKVIVNCGSSSAAGQWRELLRSTAAHSTLIVDHRNICPQIGGGMLYGLPEVSAYRHEDHDISLIEAKHKGYVPRFNLQHRRIVCLQDKGETLAGEDCLFGRSGIPFAVRFHLHPGIQVSSVGEDGTDVLLKAQSGMKWSFSASGMTVSIEESVYGGTEDYPLKTHQLVIHGVTQGPETFVEWKLVRERNQ